MISNLASSHALLRIERVTLFRAIEPCCRGVCLGGAAKGGRDEPNITRRMAVSSSTSKDSVRLGDDGCRGRGRRGRHGGFALNWGWLGVLTQFQSSHR